MAPGRIHLGRLVAAAVCLAFAVTGCGGGSSSSAPVGAGAGSTATSTGRAGTDEAGTTPLGGPEASKPVSPKKWSSSGKPQNTEAGESKYEKKHPPLELPIGKPEKGPTKAQQARVPTADMKVAVPGGITAANTCKGKELSPAITWGKVPPGTSELAIFAMSIKPVDGKLFFDWALAGVDPSLSGLSAGELPRGAVPGRNSAGKSGYSLCPSGAETYIFAVYALSDSLSPKPGFDPLNLREQATRASHEVGITGVTFSG